MSSTYTSHAAAALLCWISGMLFVPLGWATSYEDYLHQIEAEAKSLAATLQTKQALPTPAAALGSATPSMAIAKERLPLGMRQEQFEMALHDEFVGTYTFYQRLQPQDKRKIFQLYQQDNRVSIIREQILEALAGSAF